MSSRRASRPAPRSPGSLEKASISTDRTVADSTSPTRNETLYDRLFWAHPGDSPTAITEEPASFTAETDCQKATPHFPGHPASTDHGYIPKPYFEYAQRTLNTLIVAGTFMAGVEAQLLSLIFTAPDGPLRTAAVCFAVTALFATAFVALYCAVTYIWLRQDWRRRRYRFQDWVAGSLRMMILWCSVFLVVGVYAGFIAVVIFLFVASSRTIAIFSTVMFALCGVGPMTWGFYYWYGLYRGWLEWVPDDEGEDGTLPRKRQTSTA